MNTSMENVAQFTETTKGAESLIVNGLSHFITTILLLASLSSSQLIKMLWLGVLLSTIISVAIIVGFGVFMARRTRRAAEHRSDNVDDLILAGRNLSLFVAICTMSATWVGGVYLLGTAEVIYRPSRGLRWCVAPICYAMSLILGGLAFAVRMRRLGYVTMIDPFRFKYGERMSAILFIPALLAEICWIAANLSALGSTIQIIVDINKAVCIIISTIVIIIYTIIGGFYTVAYTDLIQLFLAFFGLWIAAIFSMANPKTASFKQTYPSWKGVLESEDVAVYLDEILAMFLGGIPWQVYFQRAHACKSATHAKKVSIVAAVVCYSFAFPAIILGAVAKDAPWKTVGYTDLTNNDTMKEENMMMILPLVVRYFCPPFVTCIATGAILAAFMSSMDSSMLSGASMLARNIVKLIIWRSASEKNIMWVLRLGIIGIGIVACILGIFINSIYTLWIICSDVVYVLLFPQLVSVLYIRFSNTYGSLAGFVVGFLTRVAAGGENMGLPPLFKYPFHYEENGLTKQRFPIKTISMLYGFVTLLVVSFATDYFFKHHKDRLKYDYFNCYQEYITVLGEQKIRNRYNRPSFATEALPSVTSEIGVGVAENGDGDDQVEKKLSVEVGKVDGDERLENSNELNDDSSKQDCGNPIQSNY